MNRADAADQRGPLRRLAFTITVLTLLAAGCSSGTATGMGDASNPVSVQKRSGQVTRGQITVTVNDSIAQVSADGRLHRVYVPARGPRGGLLSHLDWSRDGSRIAFTADTITAISAYNGLRVLDVSTGRDRLVLDCIHNSCNFWPGLDWSTDGTRIAFSRGTDTTPDRGSIWVVNSDGSGLTQLSGGADWSDWAPSWSPDGSQIALSSRTAGRGAGPAVYLIRSDGSGRSLLSPQGRSPAWSPDGREIAYIRFGKQGDGFRDCEVWERRPDGSSPILLLHRNTCSSWQGLAWSPDGRQIAVGLDVIMNRRGGGVTPLDLTPAVRYQSVTGPAW